MKKLFMILYFLTMPFFLFAQEFGITNNGKYAFAEMYSVKKNRLKDFNNLVVIRSTTGKWYKEYRGIDNLKFAVDSKKLFFMQKGNLYTLNLGGEIIDSIKNIETFTLEGTSKNYLVYKCKSERSLYIKNLSNSRVMKITDCDEYFAQPETDILLVKSGQGENSLMRLLKVDVSKCTTSTILQKQDVKIIWHKFSPDGSKAVLYFTSKLGNSIWLYDVSTGTTKEIISDGHGLLSQKYKLEKPILNNTIMFTPNGKRLLFHIGSDRIFPKTEDQRRIENLLSYLDPKPNYYWRQDRKNRIVQMAVFDLSNNGMHIVEGENDIVEGSIKMDANVGNIPQVNDDYAIVYHFEKDVLLKDKGKAFSVNASNTFSSYNYNRYLSPDVYLVNLNDGKRKLIMKQVSFLGKPVLGGTIFSISPFENQVVYYDMKIGCYFSYEIATGKIRNISLVTNTQFSSSQGSYDFTNYGQNAFLPKHGLLWLTNKSSILTLDFYGDVWLMELGGQGVKNLTNSASKQNKFDFYNFSQVRTNILKYGDTLILKSFPFEKGGLYQLNISNKPLLKELIPPRDSTVEYVKAKGSNMYVWKIQNTFMPPTFYMGSDYSIKTPILKQQGDENPIKHEYVKWNDSLGNELDGFILFPRGFDSSKKYPALVTCYQSAYGTLSKVSDVGGNQYLDYEKMPSSPLNDGYIVFIIGIKFKVGFTASIVANAVISGTKKLISKPYVNSRKLGIYGESFSGWHVNNVIVRTNIFAAALSQCGYSNITSVIGEEDMDGAQVLMTNMVANGQLNMGAELWDRPDLYLAGSPVFYADRVTCPLLLSHGRQDFRVPFDQGMEFYKALQANGKKVWLFAPDGGHGPIDNILRKQFFAHYLKDEPAPYWMTRPIMEIIEKDLDPYAFDPEITTPGNGIIQKDKIYGPLVKELLKNRTTIDLSGRIINVIR